MQTVKIQTQAHTSSIKFLQWELCSCSPHTEDCIEPDGPCDENAICRELPGRNNFTCTCMPMFVGDGFICQ